MRYRTRYYSRAAKITSTLPFPQHSNCGCSWRIRFIAMPAAAVRISTPSLAYTRSKYFLTMAGLAAGIQEQRNYLPTMEIDAQSDLVRADGQQRICEPASSLPMTQRYFLL